MKFFIVCCCLLLFEEEKKKQLILLPRLSLLPLLPFFLLPFLPSSSFLSSSIPSVFSLPQVDRLSTRGASNVDVLFATAWIVGEYAPLLMRPKTNVVEDGEEGIGGDDDIETIAGMSQEEAQEEAMARNAEGNGRGGANATTQQLLLHEEISMAMLQTRNLQLPMLVQCAFVHNALKVVLGELVDVIVLSLFVVGCWLVVGGCWWD